MGNTYDHFAMAASRGGSTVGHLPIEFSKLAWHFLHHGGHIVCEITGNRQRSSVLSSCSVYLHFLGQTEHGDKAD